MPVRFYAVAALLLSLPLAGCEDGNKTQTKPAKPMSAAAPTNAPTATATAHKKLIDTTIPLPKGGRREAKVNAVFYYFPLQSVDELAAKEKKLLMDAGMSIDAENKVDDYHILEVSLKPAQLKISIGCGPKECFISVQDAKPRD